MKRTRITPGAAAALRGSGCRSAHGRRQPGRPAAAMAVAMAAALAILLVCAATAAPAAESYLWPMHGPRRISSSFSEYRGGHYHAGIDLRSFGAIGLPCLAVSDGHVSRVKIEPFGYGLALYLRLADGRTAVYAHLDRFSGAIDSVAWHYRVERETNWCDFTLPPEAYPVAAGDTVAWSGQSGASAPHLHFEIRDEAQRPLNPLKGFYSIPDRSPPVISGLMVLPLDERSVTAEGPVSAVREFRPGGANRFVLTDTLHLDGSFGFAVAVWDEQGYGGYAMAPATIELSVGGQTLYSVRNRVFSFTQANEIRLEYEIAGAGPAGRYLVMLPRRGGTREDRGGPGAVRLSPEGPGLQLEPGLHRGLITAVDAAGNRSEAVFHFALQRFPVVTLAERLRTAGEVVVAAHDPGGGPVRAALFESGDGGRTWSRVLLEQVGACLRGAVSGGDHDLYRLDVAGDRGAAVTRWFADPTASGVSGMVFCEIVPYVTPHGVALRIMADRALASPPLVTATAGGTRDTLSVFVHGPDEFRTFAAPPRGDGGVTVFSVSGMDHRGYPLRAHRAVRAAYLLPGGGVSFTLSDTLAVRLEAHDARRPFAVLLRETPPPAGAPAGLEEVSSAFAIEFTRDAIARPLRLHCAPGANVGLFEWSDGREWSCVGVPGGGAGHAPIGRSGTYAFFRDTRPPRILPVRLETTATRSEFYRAVYCALPVEENGVGVDPWSAKAFLNGHRMVCEWDPYRKRLVVPIPAFIPAGRAVLGVEIADRAGNRSAAEYGFMLE